MSLLRRAHALRPGGRHQPGAALIGAPLLHLARVGSTNDVALALASRGAPEGTLVTAQLQTAGRGRRGRTWHAPPGASLFCSVVLRPPLPQRRWPDLSWIVAGAVAEAAVAHGARAVSLKHPNDVLAGARKLAGVLLECRSAPGAAAAVVAGFGVNVELPPDPPAEGLRLPATCLAAEIGGAVDRAAFLAAACAALERGYATWARCGPDAVRRELAAAGVGVEGLADAAEEGEG